MRVSVSLDGTWILSGSMAGPQERAGRQEIPGLRCEPCVRKACRGRLAGFGLASVVHSGMLRKQRSIQQLRPGDFRGSCLSRRRRCVPRSGAGSLSDDLPARCYAGLVGLLGRLSELAACRGALSDAGVGAAAAVIAGAAGIGKTSVWRAAAESRPAGVVVLRTTGEPGGQAAFANLADLLDPAAERVLPELPEPQAGALRAALGLAAAEVPLRETLIERAVVTALAGLARDGMVVAVDDEQWVDA